jgi:hypothetical protein
MSRTRFHRMLATPAAPAAGIPAPSYYWKFNDNLTASKGGVVLAGDDGYDAGKYGSALVGEADVGSGGVPAFAGAHNGEWAVSFWFRKPQLGSEVVVKQVSSGALDEIRLTIDYDAGPEFQRAQMLVGMAAYTSDNIGEFTNPNMSHAGFIASGGLLTLYVNGAEVISLDISGEGGTFDVAGTFGVTVAGFGRIDDLAVWVGGTLPTPADMGTIAASAAGDLSTLY